MLKITKTDLQMWLEKIAKEYELIIPVKENVVQFKPVDPDIVVYPVLHFTNSVLPPKHIFFPQTDNLFAFHKERDSTSSYKLEITPPPRLKKKRVICGMRPCDVSSLRLLDCVFRGEIVDSFYLERRENTILIGMACNQPATTCFCESFGINPIRMEGTDIFLTEQDEFYSVNVSTDRGEQLINLAPSLFQKTEHRGQKTENRRQIRTISIDKVYECIETQKDNGIWADISQICIECGICAYLCPACYCFDIQDEQWEESTTHNFIDGVRFRCWDSCMFYSFTLMASGENPRQTKKDRIRNRFFHKFKYFKDKYGSFGCVGCGRCIDRCPVNIDITRVLEKLI